MRQIFGLKTGRQFGSVPPIRGFACSQVALIALLAALLCVSDARAGTMYVYSCHTPNGTPARTAGWAPMPGASRSQVSDDCTTGARGTLFATATGDRPIPPAMTVWWSFTAAPNTSISGFSTYACARIDGTWAWITWNRPTPREGTSPFAFPEGHGVPSDIFCHGPAPYWSDSRNLVQRQGLATSQVFLVATCGFCDDPSLRSSIEISSFRADIRDDSAPVVGAVRGPLAANFSHTGVERIEFDVSDVGVGVYRAVVEARIHGQGNWLELASAPVGRNASSCVEKDVTPHRYEFDSPQPCPLSISAAALDFDSGLLPPGQHALRVSVEDAAGNRGSVLEPRSFVVPPPPGSAAPALLPSGAVPAVAPRPAVLRIADASRRALPSAEAFRVRGTLTEADDRPLAGVTLTVRTRPFLPKPARPAGEWTVVGQVVTGPDGRFDARIPAGASRTVQFMREEGDGLAAVAAQVDVTVPAKVSATARATRIRNGRSAVFTGRVAGPIPPGGVLVALEVREPGRWIPVATTRRWVRTTPAGRFKLAYRFRRTYEPSTYRFRVVAAEDSAFPYTRGVSRTIAVRVRP